MVLSLIPLRSLRARDLAASRMQTGTGGSPWPWWPLLRGTQAFGLLFCGPVHPAGLGLERCSASWGSCPWGCCPSSPQSPTNQMVFPDL